MGKFHFITNNLFLHYSSVLEILCFAFLAYFQFLLLAIIVYGNKMRQYHLLF